MAPHIHREDIRDMTVKVGEAVRFTVHVDGEPAPEIHWQLNGKAVEQTTVIENIEYITKFAVGKANRFVFLVDSMLLTFKPMTLQKFWNTFGYFTCKNVNTDMNF